MGLFGLFKKHPQENPLRDSLREVCLPDNLDKMSVYSHMRVEVTSSDGQLLFVAKLMNPREGSAELYQYSESSLSEDIESVRVRIRGYHEHQRKAVYMEGVISPRPKHIWHVDDLSVTRVGNDRAFFRLELNLDASVTKFSGRGAGERPCKLLNLSVGGVRISSEERYWEGDKLLLNVKLYEERDNSVMYCQVLRVIKNEDASYEYGCQFLELTEAVEGKITRNIFALQRKMRGSSK